MKKRIFLSILISLLSLFIFSVCGNAVQINAATDPNTSHIEQLFSNDTSGKIAIDKTVEYNQNEYINNLQYGISDFSVTLSAIGQDFIQNITESEEQQYHPDIMFVVDVSGSMKDNMAGSQTNRIQSTVQALNLAINSLVAQDPETRWGVISFGNNYYTNTQRAVGTYRLGLLTRNYNTPAGLYLPIHKYTSTNGTYFSYNNNQISTVQLRDENSTRYNSTSYTVNRDGTYTQAGLYGAYKAFQQVQDTTNRYPVVILITDGIPTIVDEDIWPVDDYPGISDTQYNFNQFNNRHITGHGYTNETNEEFFGLAIETAIRLKKELTQLYEKQALYITIGPGVDYLVGKMFLNPSNEHLAEAANDNTIHEEAGSCTPAKLKQWLETHSTEEEYHILTDLSDFSLASNFSLAEYTQAMTEMTSKVFEQHFSPFENEDSFTTIIDNIKDMALKGTPKLSFYSEIFDPISINGNEYEYIHGIKVKITENNLIWTIPNQIVPLFKTNNFTNIQPIRLIYVVGLTELNEFKTYYTNDFANSNFTINEENPYYKNFTTQINNKEQNLTNTEEYVNQIIKTNNDITIDLGNNGLIEFLADPKSRSYVLDYGLQLQHPGVIEDNIETSLIGIAQDENAYSIGTELEGTYGTISVDSANNNIIYSLNTLNFTDIDSYYLMYDITQVYDLPAHLLTYLELNYIPATFIYYEDNFSKITYTNSNNPIDEYGIWKEIDSADETLFQNADLVNNKNSNIYGYDQAYDNCMLHSNGSTHYVEVCEGMGPDWPFIEFDFTGIGFDIISTTDNLSGVLLITITDDDGNVEHKYIVDNYYGCIYEGEEYVPYPNIEKCLYQIPVIKCSNLEYKHHNVLVRPIFTKIFNHYSVDENGLKYSRLYFDAVRIYTPSMTENSINYYILDNENQPYFEEVKNNLIANKNLTEEYTEGMIFIDGKGAIASSTLMDNVEANPNNEIYLVQNQMITFRLQSKAIPNQTALGLKVASGDNTTKVKVYYGSMEQELNLNTSTDMYYAFDELGWVEENGMYVSDTIIIKNTSNSVLSLTNIKTTGADTSIITNNAMYDYAINRIKEPEEQQQSLSRFQEFILRLINFFKMMFNFL